MITIVIPYYNRASFLGRTLDSVAAQTLRPLNVVLVDNGSTDNSADIARQWRDANLAPDFRITLAEELQRSPSAARNAGLALVETPYVMFFDSDDIMLPEHCADMARAIARSPQADIIGKSNTYHTLSGDSRPGLFTDRNPLYNHIFHCILATQRYVVRTDYARRTGCWDVRTWGWDDYEFGMRLLLGNPSMATAEGKPTVIVKQHPESITGTAFSTDPANWEYTLDVCSSDLRKAGRGDLLPLLDIRRMTLAANYAREGAKAEAKRLHDQVMKTTLYPVRMRLAYLLQRVVGHGNAILSRLLFPKLARERKVETTQGQEPIMTIVIPYYNRASYLQRTLDSVAAQTLRPLRVVLVDNGSTDNSAEIVRQWRDEHQTADFQVTVAKESRHGAPAARNAGLALVETPYVMFFDSDDIMLPEHCADMARAIALSPEADIVGKSNIHRTLNGRTREGFFTTKHPLYNHIFHCILATQRYVVRTDYARRMGPWNNKAWGWNDYEYGLRLLLGKPSMAKAPGKPTAIFEHHVNSITGTAFSTSPAKWEDTLRLCVGDLEDSGRADLLPLIDMRRMTLAANYAREGARSEARRLRSEVLARTPYPLKMRLAYLLQRRLGHGNARLARLLFPSLCRD